MAKKQYNSIYYDWELEKGEPNNRYFKENIEILDKYPSLIQKAYEVAKYYDIPVNTIIGRILDEGIIKYLNDNKLTNENYESFINEQIANKTFNVLGKGLGLTYKGGYEGNEWFDKNAPNGYKYYTKKQKKYIDPDRLSDFNSLLYLTGSALATNGRYMRGRKIFNNLPQDTVMAMGFRYGPWNTEQLSKKVNWDYINQTLRTLDPIIEEWIKKYINEPKQSQQEEQPEQQIEMDRRGTKIRIGENDLDTDNIDEKSDKQSSWWDYDYNDVVQHYNSKQHLNKSQSQALQDIIDVLNESEYSEGFKKAILHNIFLESGFNPNASNGSHYGLLQWTPNIFNSLSDKSAKGQARKIIQILTNPKMGVEVRAAYLPKGVHTSEETANFFRALTNPQDSLYYFNAAVVTNGRTKDEVKLNAKAVANSGKYIEQNGYAGDYTPSNPLDKIIPQGIPSFDSSLEGYNNKPLYDYKTFSYKKGGKMFGWKPKQIRKGQNDLDTDDLNADDKTYADVDHPFLLRQYTREDGSPYYSLDAEHPIYIYSDWDDNTGEFSIYGDPYQRRGSFIPFEQQLVVTPNNGTRTEEEAEIIDNAIEERNKKRASDSWFPRQPREGLKLTYPEFDITTLVRSLRWNRLKTLRHLVADLDNPNLYYR